MWLFLYLLPVVVRWPASGAAPRAPIIDPQSLTVRTLDNGLRVVIREAHSAHVVALHVWVRAGSRYETSENNGISHVIEHMVFRGSQNKKAEEVSNEIESVGGYTNAETTKDATRYYAIVPSAHLDLAVKGFADALLRPTFRQSALDSEKRAMTVELGRRLMNPIVAIQEMVEGKAFKIHPYGLPMGGKVSNLEKITTAMVQDFHRRFYVAKNMTVVVVGDVNPEEAYKLVAEAFGPARSDPPPKTVVPSEPPQSDLREVMDSRDVQQTAVTLAMHAPGMNTPEAVLAMDVLITLLGEGKTSRLQKVLKGTPSLVIEYEVDFLTQKDPGLFAVTCVLPPENLEAVRAAVVKSLADLQETPVGPAELAKAKTLLEGQYAASNETFEGQAGSLGFYEAIDSYQFALTYIDRIREVTASDVQRVAKGYLTTSAYTFGVLRPRASKPLVVTPEARALLGPAEWRLN